MTRKNTQVNIASGVRYTSTIQDEVLSEGSQIRIRQHAMLSELVNDGVFTGMLNCGPIPFQKLRMEHVSGYWTIYLEATEERQ